MYHFLLIEDYPEDAESFQDTISRLNDIAGEELYRLEIAKTYDDGIKNIYRKWDGVIIDITLDEGRNGNDIIDEIRRNFPVPVAVFTGTPDVELFENIPVKIYKKGEAPHEEIICDLKAISDTGMFNVLGGKGIMNDIICKIFWENLYPQSGVWEAKKARGEDTEMLLLRYAVAHIQEFIDEEMPTHVTEEMYISPPLSDAIKTGVIIQEKSGGPYYIVLSPPCDLVLRSNGKMKTDNILICEIEPQDTINHAVIGNAKKDRREKKIANALRNNHAAYYHWLPQNTLFVGGYINFRKVITYSPEELKRKFCSPLLKVQERFVKAILNRFSAYYARQGQPDFNFEEEAENIVKGMYPSI